LPQAEEDMGWPVVHLPDLGRVQAFDKLEEVLEALAGHISINRQMKYPVASGSTVSELTQEFTVMEKRIMTDVEKGNADGTAEVVLKQLEIGRDVLEKLHLMNWKDDSSATPAPFLTFLNRARNRRANVQEYLDDLFCATEEMRRHIELYRGELKDHVRMLAEVAKFTQMCEIPTPILSQAEKKSIRLAFLRARRLKMKARKDKPTPAQAVLDALRSQALGSEVSEEQKELVDVPSQSFRLRQLIHKGVVVRINDKVDQRVREQMQVSFQYKDEGYMVQLYLKSTLLKEFFISRQDIRLAEGGRKNAVLPYGDEFLWFSCCRLRRLLAFVSAEGGL